jgi:DNA sulfur modification protein DndE
MYNIRTTRIRFTIDADNTLKMMKARTGLTPNILCRLALTLSLDEPGLPRLIKDEKKSEREINRYTLMGEYDSAFVALTKTRLRQDAIGADQAEEFFVAHIHRGISLLPNRVKALADLAGLLPE